ncbi:unnamed protein product [Ixodes hexagonus]
MEETWRVRWEEMRAKMKDVEERKEAEERQVEELGEKMKKEGERMEEMQREAERERKECEKLRQAVSEMQQDKGSLHSKKLREREGQEEKEKAKKEQLEANKTSENSEQGNEGEKTRESPVGGGRSYMEVLTQERQGKGDDKDEDRCKEGREDTRVEGGVKQKRVIVVGSSNVTRCVAGVRSRVGGEEKVKMVACPGKCMSEVMESAKELVWENQGGGGETWSSFMQG